MAERNKDRRLDAVGGDGGKASVETVSHWSNPRVDHLVLSSLEREVARLREQRDGLADLVQELADDCERCDDGVLRPEWDYPSCRTNGRCCNCYGLRAELDALKEKP